MEFKIPMPWGHVSAKSYGSWHGQPVLAIHDWLDNSGTFDKLAAQISKDIQFVVIDLPGHGLSSHVPMGINYHKMDMVSVLKRIIEHQKWKKFSILGHGVGAELGILYAAAFGPLIKSLILLDGIKPFSVNSVDELPAIAAAVDKQLELELKYEESKTSPITFSYQDGIKQLIEQSNGDLTEESAKILMIRGAKEDSNGNWSFTNDLRLDCEDALRPNHDQCFNILKGLKGLPVLFLKPANSPWTVEQTLRETTLGIYRDICQPFTEMEIEGNHYVHLNEPEKIVNSINEQVLA